MNRIRTRSRGGKSAVLSGFNWPTFAAGAVIATLGDSITQENNAADATNRISKSNGIIGWALRDLPLYKHKIWYDAAAPHDFYGCNFGIGGDTTADLAARLTPVINLAPDIAVVLIGTNTGASDSTAATKIPNIESIVADLTAQGIFVILYTILPRTTRTSPTGFELSPALMAEILTTNAAIRAMESDMVAICDPWVSMLDPAYTEVDDEYGSILPAYTRDGVHLTAQGAFAAAVPLRTILQTLSGGADMWGTWFDSNIAGSADNRFNNGEFTGTSGALSGGATGSMPTNISLQGPGVGANSSVVASLSANAVTGGQTIRLTITSDGLGGTTPETIFINPTGAQVNYTGFANGEWMQNFYKVKVVDNDDGIIGNVYAYNNNATSGIYCRAFEHYGGVMSDAPIPATGFDIWIQTEPDVRASSNAWFYYVIINVLENVAGTAIIDIEAATMLEVADPTTEFPYTP